MSQDNKKELYYLYNGNTRISNPIELEEAKKRLNQMKSTFYPDVYMVSTEDEAVKGPVDTGPAEVLEDRGCASGACTL